jgi:hypothetical protein
MITVQFPEPRFRIREQEGVRFIFDGIRRSWLQLTEEEWVRQNFVSFLVNTLQYPEACIALEKELLLNNLKKRFDILVYNGEHKPWMMVECKAPHIPLKGEVLEQVLRYNITIPVSCLVITNGRQTMAWQKKGTGLLPLQELPAYGANEM